MSETKQRPVALHGGSVSGHAVVTIEIRYEYDLDDLLWLKYYGEFGDTEEDLEENINADLGRYLSRTIESDMENLGYNHGEPEVICATDAKILDHEVSDLEIEMEDHEVSDLEIEMEDVEEEAEDA